MKILLINGSPKCEKSDTLCVTRAFIDGMNSVAENEVKYFNVRDKHIEYCLGCLGCMTNGGHCVHDDDMASILRDILASDLIVFSFPLYGYGVPAPLKALLDRTLPLANLAMVKTDDRYVHVSQANTSHIRYCVISGCGFPNARNNFDALRLEMKLRFRDNLYMLTVPEAPMFNVKAAEQVTLPYLALVKEAGAEYMKTGRVSEELSAKLAIPMIPEETYAKIVSQNA